MHKVTYILNAVKLYWQFIVHCQVKLFASPGTILQYAYALLFLSVIGLKDLNKVTHQDLLQKLSRTKI